MDIRLRNLERQVHSGDPTVVTRYLFLKERVSTSPMFCVRSQTGRVQHLVNIIGSGLVQGYGRGLWSWRLQVFRFKLGQKPLSDQNLPIETETACGQEGMKGWGTAEDYNRRHHFSETQPTCKNCLRSQFYTYHLQEGKVPHGYILRTDRNTWHLAYPPFLFNQYRTRCELAVDHNQRFMLYPGPQYGIQQEIDHPDLHEDGGVFCSDCRKAIDA